MTDSSHHHGHPEVVARLRRADGHLASTIEMIEKGRSCLAIAQQLQAVESAVEKALKLLIQEHLEHCLDEAVDHLPAEARKAINDFKSVVRYL